jgi:transposase
MKAISIGLAFLFVLLSAPPRAQGAGVEICRAAISEKRPCAGTRLASPARSQCYRAAMQRCRANGSAAI